jgi:hypothetical protein
MTPGEGAQERPHRRCRGGIVTHYGSAAAGAQHVDVVDAVTSGEQQGNHRQRLGSRVRRTRHGAKVEMLIHRLPQPELLAQRSG